MPMIDPIQAAIREAEQAVAELESAYHEGLSTIYLRENVHAAIRSLAALVREYGHVAGCGCCDLKHPQHNFGQREVHVDPRCLEAK